MCPLCFHPFAKHIRAQPSTDPPNSARLRADVAATELKARRALEHGASSVVLLARHDVVIMSRAAGLLVDRHVDGMVLATTVLETLWNAYSIISPAGTSKAALEALFFTPTKTMLPTSDFYFVARAAKKLNVVVGEVAKMEHGAVVTKCGQRLIADLLIKCVGFTQDTSFDKAMRADLSRGGRVTTFHHSNSTIRMRKGTPHRPHRETSSGVPATGSGVNTGDASTASTAASPAGAKAKTYAPKTADGSQFTGGSGGFRHWSPCYSFIQKVEQLPAKDLDASNAVLRERVALRSRAQPLRAFLAEQAQEWAAHCKVLGVRIAYPYTLAELERWDLHLAREIGSAGGGSSLGGSGSSGGGGRTHGRGDGIPFNLLVP